MNELVPCTWLSSGEVWNYDCDKVKLRAEWLVTLGAT